jgi:hypothetical protein
VRKMFKMSYDRIAPDAKPTSYQLLATIQTRRQMQKQCAKLNSRRQQNNPRAKTNDPWKLLLLVPTRDTTSKSSKIR